MSLVSVANAADSAAPVMTTSTSLMSLFPMILIFVIFYFFLIRPQVKRQKTLDNMINELKKGDQVIAAGGLYGTISRIEDDALYIEIADNIKIKALKSSVSEVLSKSNKVEAVEKSEEKSTNNKPVKPAAKLATKKAPAKKKK